jgi:hypothetical protein
MTVAHMLFSFIVLAPFMMMQPFRSLHKATLEKQWKGLICIGAFMALNIALSLNQVIRCGHTLVLMTYQQLFIYAWRVRSLDAHTFPSFVKSARIPRIWAAGH